MSQYVIGPNKGNCIYDLCGVINHIGQSLYLGHYTAFARMHDRDNTANDEVGWRLFDDSNVSPIKNKEHIVSQDAYVLLYRLRTKNTMSEANSESESNAENVSVSSEDEYHNSEESVTNDNSDEFTDLNGID